MKDMFESVGTWWRNLTHRHGDDRNNDDTLDDATNTLLSILPLASIVVDEHDEVIRAHPDAYALGVVRDDAIADDTVASAVHEVRAHGGKKQFSLTTTTLHEPKKAPKAGKPTMREVAKTGVDRPIAGQAGDHGVPPELAEGDRRQAQRTLCGGAGFRRERNRPFLPDP